MLKIEKNHPIAQYTTFKIGSFADYFVIVKNKKDLLGAIEFSKKNKLKIFVLGGGSNILFSGRVPGLLIKNEIKGIKVLEKSKTRVLLEGLSGENWSRFVSYAVNNRFYGLENLFLIYGTVGAAPVQNIGAYGVELKDVFYHLKAINLKTGNEKIFSKKDCQFAYRDSIFKNKLRGKYFIYSVTVNLSLRANLKLAYGSIRDKLSEKGIANPSISELIKVIEEIRNSKLPNPNILPNAGSFFKNPEISSVLFKKLIKKYPDIVFFPGEGKKTKISAAWLIEKAGFKGKRVGSLRMYEKQALIMVNDGGASAKQALNLVTRIKKKIAEKFDIDLKEEVNII